MKRIAVLSDTHGLLREEVKAYLHNVDLILHAGDLDTPDVLEELRSFAPTAAVRGNNDRDWAFSSLPYLCEFTIEGMRILMTHDRSDLPYEKTLSADLIVFGHSHRWFFEQREDGRIFLNPGSCGKPRFGGALSFCIIEVDENGRHVKRIDL